MGVDFTSISNVIIKPIPEKYRAKKTQIDKTEIVNKLSTLPSHMVSLFMALNGVSIDGTNEVCAPDELEISDEACKWSNELNKNESLLTIDWYNNKIYYSSEESKTISTGRSYAGYGDFIEYCNKFTKFRYTLPSTNTAPENGNLTDDNKVKILFEDLNKIKSILVGKNNNVPNFENHNWFFEEFYEMVKNARNNGIIQIC